MKIIRVASTAALLLLFGAAIPAYPQHEEKKDEKSGGRQEQHAQPPQRAQQPAPPQHAEQPRAREQQHTQQGQPQPPQVRAEQTHQTQPARPPEQHAAPPQQQHAQQQPQQRGQQTQQVRQQPPRTQEQARAWQQQKGWANGGGSVGHATFQQSRSQNWAGDHRSWAQRGGYGGYYIPQDRFSVSFGSQHFFRLGGLPVMYLGYPRFAYGGFSFLLVDPWPGDWSGNWYSADDVYIDYDDGYYLYNRSHPQERLAITIAL